MQFLTVDSFYQKAPALRRVFDRRFKNPLRGHNERFVWDFWHVPNEYTLLRTPAYHYFPKSIYEPFHRYLVSYGRKYLGCHDISPPWLSCYIEGCKQEPHQDVPHGPLAFVFSLTNWRERIFKGGETFISNPRAIIDPEFNRLILFNPSLTHGVRQVKGTMDPRHGRLVIHGWFVNPRPFWVGPLTTTAVERALDGGLPQILSKCPALGAGLLTVRLSVNGNGQVKSVELLISTLLNSNQAALRRFQELLTTLTFPKARGPSQITLPLMLS